MPSPDISGAIFDLQGQPLVGVASAKYDDLEDIRYGIALKTAEAYSEAGVPFVVVDASNEAEVAHSLKERGAIVVKAERPGLATQYIDGVQFALDSGADKIVRHEPEKLDMVKFAGQISARLSEVDILVIGRTDRAMASLPPVQAKTERLGGWLMQKHLGFPPDALSGGRGYNRRGASLLLEYDVATHGNNWLHLHTPVIEARDSGFVVDGLQVDLMHPPEMTTEESDNPAFDTKRYEQLMLQMEALLPGYVPLPSFDRRTA